MNIGKALRGVGDGFRTGAGATASGANETVNRTAYKIRRNTQLLKNERAKQAKLDKVALEELQKKSREDQIESKAASSKVPLTLKAIFIDKPLDIFKYIATAWVIKNGPKLLKILGTFTKKVRIFVASIKRVPGAVLKVLGATINFATVFMENVLNFDFEDKEKQMKAAQKNFDKQMGDVKVTFGELVNVWNRNEDELDSILKNLDSEDTISQSLENAGIEDFDYVVPTTPMLGRQPESGGSGGGSTRSGKVGALLDTISYAEGTPSYGTIYGGAVVPELAAGLLSVSEVIQMQKTGKVRGRDAGYKRDGYDSDATGRYQFMSYVLEEEVEKQGISMSEKFTPALQDKLILGRMARMRGVTEEGIEKGGLTPDIIDRLAPEFASFPNLKGPDAQGRTGTNTSYYGQGGKSQEELQNFYANAQNTNLQSQMPALPEGQSSSQLVGKVPYSQFSKSAAQGGTGSVGVTDGYLARGGTHKGIDIGTSGGKGYYVSLKIDGKVTYVGAPDGIHRGAGKMIIIADARNPSREYVFMHMEKILLRSGQTYKAGTPIGEIGNTGGSSGEHLHYEVRINNRHVDPMPYLKLIEIGRLNMTTRSSGQNISSNPGEIAEINSQTIASNKTGGTRTKTKVITTTQKEYIMVG